MREAFIFAKYQDRAFFKNEATPPGATTAPPVPTERLTLGSGVTYEGDVTKLSGGKMFGGNKVSLALERGERVRACDGGGGRVENELEPSKMIMKILMMMMMIMMMMMMLTTTWSSSLHGRRFFFLSAPDEPLWCPLLPPRACRPPCDSSGTSVS